MLTTITQNVSIEAMYLDSNIKNHILNKLKKNMEGKCTFEYGYIITVNKIIRIGDNTIGSANSLVIFNIVYEADVLKPETGHVLSGKVCMVFQHGIFVNVYEKMKVLVPATSMINYKYQQDQNNFTWLEQSIENGVEVTIDIVMTKYEKKQFSCIGKLHESESKQVTDTDTDTDTDTEDQSD